MLATTFRGVPATRERGRWHAAVSHVTGKLMRSLTFHRWRCFKRALTPETNELIQGICIDLFWRRTSPDGALLQLADVNVFSTLYRVRREVHRNDRAELTETDMRRCWKILYDEFMTTLSPQHSRYTTRKKHSLFHSSLKRRFGNKRFIFAVWQTGKTWLPEPWDMRPHAMVNALCAWCRRFRTAEREYLQRVNEADGTQPFRM